VLPALYRRWIGEFSFWDILLYPYISTNYVIIEQGEKENQKKTLINRNIHSSTDFRN
jgi:hypothetical protein